MKNRTTRTHPLLSLSLFILLLAAACNPIKGPALEGSIPQASAVTVSDRIGDEDNKELETAEAVGSKTVVEPEKAESLEVKKSENIVEPEPNAAPSVGVSLASDGLNLFVGDGAKTRRLPFGTDIEMVKEVLTNVWGEPVRVSNNVLCEPRNQEFDTVLWPNGFIIRGLEGSFVGWETHGSTLITTNGIGAGSTLAELKDSYGNVQVFEDALGSGFDVGNGGGIEGRLSSPNSDAVITDLNAGDRCFYY